MAPASKTGMVLAELKSLLKKAAPDNPIPCAFGQGDDQALALLMMHKSKPPKAVAKDLETDFPTAKNTRWGTAIVEEFDPGLVKFVINKASSGMAKRLVKTLKGTGYSKVEIVLEDGTPVEGARDEEEAAPGSEASSESASGDVAAPDIGALQKTLAGLIPRIAGAGAGDVAALGQMKKHAVEAGARIKAGDAAGAAVELDALRELVEKPAVVRSSDAAPGREKPRAGIVQFQKSRLLWDAARKKVHREIEALKDAIQESYLGDPEEDEALSCFDDLDTILLNFDDSLLDKLDELLDAGDEPTRDKLAAEVKTIVTGYLNYLKTDKLVSELDGENPFGVPLSVGSTLTKTLETLGSHLA